MYRLFYSSTGQLLIALVPSVTTDRLVCTGYCTVAALSKGVCDRSPVETAGSNLAGGMKVCLVVTVVCY